VAITVEHYLNRRTRRRKPWRWILALMLGSAVAYSAFLAMASSRVDAPQTGIGKPLDLVKIENLPDWARQVIHEQQLGADYQFVAAIVDLDRDQQFEILLAPAPPTPDVFVADHPLAVIRYRDQVWQYLATPVSCRPTQLGSFVTNGSWDLPCRTINGRTVLRWSGSNYVEAS
jgi:hypothetical protein